MQMAKEDLLRVREIAASKGCEMTPQEVIDLLQEVKPDLEIVDEPGLVTFRKDLGENTG
jgi:hypothetical protein